VQEKKPGISPEPQMDQRVVAREERIEYRDQDGNILNEEEVEALKGKVEFKTRYETRTRLIDEFGNEVPPPPGEDGPKDPVNPPAGGAVKPGSPVPVAPPHPDVQGVDQKTNRVVKQKLVPDDPIPEAKSSIEGEKEKEKKSARPASEGNEATAKEQA
jgi:dolichyl-phosphate-mannose-protein mannosyltransferase